MLNFGFTQEVQVEHVGKAKGVEADIAGKGAVKLRGAVQEWDGPAGGHGEAGLRGWCGAGRKEGAIEGGGSGDDGASETGNEGNHCKKRQGVMDEEGRRCKKKEG